MPRVTDPVCGMRLEPADAVTLDWEGNTLYFCSAGCRDQFVREHEANRDTLTGYIEEGAKMGDVTYRVPGMSCGHCKQAVSEELLSVEGVQSVDVDLDTKLVVVHGDGLDDGKLRAAIDEAGYEAA